MKRFDVLIVGAGQAGALTAVFLRQQGFQGSIAVLGAEANLPYERPPLSKAYLAGELAKEKLLLRPAGYWAEHGVECLLGTRVAQVDAGAACVATTHGESIGYGHLVWAAGGQARRLGCEGADLAGVHVIRTLDDVDRLREELPAAQRVVVVGGGYVGLETAAVLSKAGKHVTVLESLERVLARVTAESVSRFYEQAHRTQGVDVRVGATVSALEGARGRVRAVRLADGTTLQADLVVVGIGLVPEIEPLQRAGAACSNGIDVDRRCRTSLPAVHAVGDCVNFETAYAGGRRVRLESVQNASDQAKVVASNLTGVPTEYHAVPWFWSNQYDLRLQTVGLSIGYDATVLRGEVDRRSFSVVYLRDGKVIALDCVNAPKDFVHGKRLVAEGLSVPPDRLADPTFELRHASG